MAGREQDPARSEERLAELLTEGANPRTADLDALPTERLLERLNDEDTLVAAAVRKTIPTIAQALERILERFEQGGRLFYVGAGTSGRLGVLDAAEIPPTFGADPELFQGLIAGGDVALRRSIEGAEDDPEVGAADLAFHGLRSADAVLGIAASGRTPYVLGALRFARQTGALALGLSSNPNPVLAEEAEIVINPVVGPEAIAGSTRLKSGLAQKMVLSMLSTGLMVRRGAVYGNRMVNVQLSNHKLRARARRMVEELTGAAAGPAEAALDEAGDVRCAVMMLRLGVSAGEARQRLDAAGGVLRRALEGGRPGE